MNSIFSILAFNTILLFFILKKLKKMQETQTQFISDLGGVKSELDSMSASFDALETAINNNQGNVPQSVIDAFTALKGSADSFNTKLSNALSAAQPAAPTSDPAPDPNATPTP